MRNRSVLSLSILVLLLGSLVPVTNISVLEDSERTLFADSEPEMLVQAGTSTGHVNGSQIEATPNGWVISGDTRNSLTFGAFQLQATSVYNNQLDADSYVASIDSQGNWLWAIMPDATQGLTLVTSMTSSIGGDIFIGGLIFGDVNFGSTLLSAQN